MSQPIKTRTTVDIYGKKYTIVGNESSQHTRQVAKMVDDKMHEIHEANSYLDTTRLAVLTTVNTVNDYLKLEHKYEELLKKIEEKED